MDPDELIRGLVSVGLVVTMSVGANCQGAAGQESRSAGAPAYAAETPAAPTATAPLAMSRTD